MPGKAYLLKVADMLNIGIDKIFYIKGSSLSFKLTMYGLMAFYGGKWCYEQDYETSFGSLVGLLNGTFEIDTTRKYITHDEAEHMLKVIGEDFVDSKMTDVDTDKLGIEKYTLSTYTEYKKLLQYIEQQKHYNMLDKE